MKIGPKYKIARRLGAPIFEKTQTQKYALSSERKSKGFRGQKTDFGLQLNEKQKARFFYGVSEKQFKNYVKEALSRQGVSPVSELLSILESRLDNAVWRVGLASTHRAARQMVSHGHILVNGRKTRVPSYKLKEGDVISVREGSKQNRLFSSLNDGEDVVAKDIPAWLDFDKKTKSMQVKSKPVQADGALMFDLGQVIEFYQR